MQQKQEILLDYDQSDVLLTRINLSCSLFFKVLFVLLLRPE